MAAAMGVLHGAPVEFEPVEDVPSGGVLLALPALLQNGLLAHSRELFSMPEGYYPLESIFLLLAFMALGRIPSLEALRYQAPGEWGKLLGLDRIPEVRTLRGKLSALCSRSGQAEIWSSTLAKEWLEDQAPEAAGVFYADGHVRIYHGKLTRCRVATSPGSDSVCVAPQSTGSMPWTGSPFSWSHALWIRVS
jgi:hypothetical protein